MNKALAISLLVIGNLAAVCALSLINILAFSLTFSVTVTVLVGLAALVALGFASSQLLPVFERKFRLDAKWFILASYVSPIIGTAIYRIVYDSFALFLFIVAVSYLILGTIWCAILIHRIKANKSTN